MESGHFENCPGCAINIGNEKLLSKEGIVMKLTSIKMKMILLISVFGVIVSLIVGITEPIEAKRIANNILKKDADFISNLLSENLALGMQTRIFDNGEALNNTLNLLRNENTGKTISDVWIFNAEKKFITGLNGYKPGTVIPNVTDARVMIDHNQILDVWSRMYDSEGKILGYVGINFSKSYLRAEARMNQLYALILGFLLIAVTIVLGVFLGKSIGQPLSRMSLIAEEISRGNIDQELDEESIRRVDEIGILAQAFKNLINYMKELAEVASNIALNDLTKIATPKSEKDILGQSFQTMCLNLAAMVRSLSENSNTLASASNQLASSAEEMSKGVNEQTSQVTEVSSAVSDMTSFIMESSQNAAEVNEASCGASDTAQKGGQIVLDTIQGMQTIDLVVRESANSISQLAGSADKIGDIIKVIDDIADQTNLLALNAAIEAARAGEQGRGFAVVADEVRKLAERTGNATSKITLMIKGIQDETGEAVNSMQAGIEEVEKGRKLADQAGNSLSEIMEMSQVVMTMVAQIAKATEEQSIAVELVSKNINNITSITRETASGAEQSASAAEQLNCQAESLKAIVEKFKI